MRIALVSLCLATSLGAGAQTQDPILGRAVAREVKDLFQATCTECHGAELAKPKGKFGYVMDLERVAANPDFVTRGDPEGSPLYVMIRDNEMPGEDSKAGNFNDQQKELVKLWIALGAPSPDAPTAGASAPRPSGATTKPSEGAGQRTLRWLGQFHPAFVHFPIALMLAATLAHWVNAQQAAAFCLRISAVTSPLAAVLGWLNADFASFTAKSAQLVAWHRWLGVAAALLPAVAWWVGRQRPQWLRGFLLISSVVVLIAGALGGALTHGIDHYRW